MMSVFLVAVLLVSAAACEELLSSVSTNDLLGDFESISFHQCLSVPKQCLEQEFRGRVRS